MLLKLKYSEEGLKQTRRNTLQWCRQVKDLKLVRRTDGETAKEVYAMASKPFESRVRDAKIGLAFAALKSLFPTAEQEHLAVEIGAGRVFHKRALIAQRPRGETELKIRTDTLLTLLPDFSQEQYKKALAEDEADREKQRRSS